MSVKELAVALGKDVDHVFDCLTRLNTTGKVPKPRSILQTNVITQVCSMSGVRPTTVGRPVVNKNLKGNVEHVSLIDSTILFSPRSRVRYRTLHF